MNAAVIKLDAIRPRDGNRHVGGFDQEKLLQLIESVKEQGVLQPILVVDGDEQGTYELVAGERRVRAAKGAGLETIPAIIAEPDHDEAWYELAAIAENVQRDGIHPLDESDGLHRLAELGLSAKDTADRIGRSVDHVYGRLRLQKLTADARQFFASGKCGVGGAGKLARLPEDHQAQVLKKMRPFLNSGGHADDKTISQTIEHNTDELSKAPFDINDPTLLEGIEKLPKKVTHTGSCMDCPFRVDWEGQTYLWDDDFEGYKDVPEQQDRCSNKTCWKAKTKAHVDQERAKLEASGEKFAIASGNPTSKKKDVWGAYDYSELHQPEGEPIPKGYQKVLIESGPQAGKVVIGKRHRTSSPSAGSRDWEKEEKEREERIDRRKGLWSAVCDRIDVREAPKLLQEIDVYRELVLTLSSGYGPTQAMLQKLGVVDEWAGDAIEQRVADLKFGELRKLVAWALLAQSLSADVEDDDETDLLNRTLKRYGITEPAPVAPKEPEPLPDPETLPQPPVAEEGA